MVFPNLIHSCHLCTHQVDCAETREPNASQRISIGIPETCQLTSRSTFYCTDFALPTFLKLCSLDTLVGGMDSRSLDQRETVGTPDLAAVLVESLENTALTCCRTTKMHVKLNLYVRILLEVKFRSSY